MPSQNCSLDEKEYSGHSLPQNGFIDTCQHDVLVNDNFGFSEIHQIKRLESRVLLAFATCQSLSYITVV